MRDPKKSLDRRTILAGAGTVGALAAAPSSQGECQLFYCSSGSPNVMTYTQQLVFGFSGFFTDGASGTIRALRKWMAVFAGFDAWWRHG